MDLQTFSSQPSTDQIGGIFEQLRKRSITLRNEGIAERRKRLKRLLNWILDNRQRINKAIFEDFGKPAAEVDISEVYPAIDELRNALRNLEQWTKPEKVDAPLNYLGTRSEVRYEPKGNCLIISPWNYPFLLAVGPLISCLAAGNTAILKPSELTPNTSALICKMVSEVFAPDVVQAFDGDVDVSKELLKLPFDHIFFTGSPGVGKIVMKAAAENLSSVTLELGGKSPAIVDKTADLKDAGKRIAFGKFLNNGQTCIAPDYLLVHEEVIDALKEQIIFQTKKLFGDGERVTINSESYGKIVSSKHFQRLHELLDEAIEKGANVEMVGEADSEKLFFPPTLISNVSSGSRILEEEIFGPLLPLIPFKDALEPVNLINSKPKPLALYVFARNKSFVESILTSTSSGGACINDCVLQFAHGNLPFGGVNNSGIGKSHGFSGFLAFSNQKPVLKQRRGIALSYFFYPPFSASMRKRIEPIMRWF